MYLRIGRIVELVGLPVYVGILFEEFPGFHDCAVGSLGRVGKDERRSEREQHVLAFLAHCGRHCHMELISFHKSNDGQTEARVTACRLKDNPVLRKRSVTLGGFHHAQGYPVLDRATRILALQLHVKGRVFVFYDLVDLYQRRSSDGFQNTLIDTHKIVPYPPTFDKTATSIERLL